MKNLRRLACKFDLDQTECKSTQVHTRRGQKESQVDPSQAQLASTGKSVWPGLKGARSRYLRQFCLTLLIMSSKRQNGRARVFHLQNHGHITTENDFHAV